MTSAPEITVMLPCYNAHAFLPRALDSVRAQTFRNFEILIVDDGSNDPDTVALLDSLPDDVRVVRQENRGLAGARNTGFREARGRLVLPLDCDDWLDPAFLADAKDALDRAGDGAFVFADLALEGEASGVLHKPYNRFEQLFFNQLPYCMLMPCAAWEEAGGYDESMRLGYEDWEFNIRLAAGGYRGIPLGKPLFHYHVSASGMLASISRERHIALWRHIRERHSDTYRITRLFGLWRRWRREPSVRPLWIYLAWDLAYRLLPDGMLTGLFRLGRRFSHSARTQRESARAGTT